MKMKPAATLGLAMALALTSTVAPRAERRRGRRSWRRRNGWRRRRAAERVDVERHHDRTEHCTVRYGAFELECRGCYRGRQQHAEPVGQQLAQSVAERIDTGA